jgi:hypothetical protein
VGHLIGIFASALTVNQPIAFAMEAPGGRSDVTAKNYLAYLGDLVPHLRRLRLPKTVILGAFLADTQETAMLPVRSAIFKQDTGGLVVRWVTTGEYPLLYVFAIFNVC